jgi:hypothetical protein
VSAGVKRPKGYRGAKQNEQRRAARAPALEDEAVILTGVRSALLHYGGALERWTALAKKGATDEDVWAHIRRSLGEHGYSGGPGMPSVHHWGGTRPRIVVEEPERRGRRGARKARTVAGVELLRAARWLFEIPLPGERWDDCVCSAPPCVCGAAAVNKQRVEARARRARAPKPPTPERAVAAGGHIKKCLSTEWYTPESLLAPVRLVLTGDELAPIPLDPYSPPHNPTRAARFFTVREDGNTQPWDAPWFAQPPYGRALRPALAKIGAESLTFHAGARMPGIALLPCSRWEQGYMHDLLRRAVVVCYVRKRVKFVKASTGDAVGGTPMASMFLGFNVDPLAFAAAFRDVGLCLYTSEL